MVQRRHQRVEKFHNVQETATEENFPGSHQKVRNKTVFVEIALDPENLVRMNI